MLDRLVRGGGGAEVFASGLAAEMAGRGIDVRVCTTRFAEGFLLDRLNDAGVPHVSLGRRGRYDVLPFIRLVRYLRRERIDVVHSHMHGSNLWGALLGRLARVRVVVAHEHTWSYEGQPLRKFLDGYVIGRLVSAFVAVSSIDRERMITLEHVPAAKTVVIPAAYVPRSPTGAAPADLRAELGIGSDTPLVGAVAVLRPQKALDVLIDAIVLLRERHPDVRLVVLGEGPEQERWEQYAADRGMSGVVSFLGMRPGASELIGSFDVSALSSDFEGTPLFVMETMAQGVPFVGTDVGGLADIATDGRSALLVGPRDPRALADAIHEVLSDSALAARLAEAAREDVRELAIESVSQRIEALYRRLLAGGPPAEA